jgi:hypothetical protein
MESRRHVREVQVVAGLCSGGTTEKWSQCNGKEQILQQLIELVKTQAVFWGEFVKLG